MAETDVKDRLEKGRLNHRRWQPQWAECLAFFEGRQFVYRSQTYSGWTVNELPTAEGGTKPQHRARTVRNFIQKFVVAEVSMGTQRTPGYEVTPTTTDPEDVQAAKLSEKVLLYLYDFLGLRKHLVDAYTYAVCTGEGFLRPFWNPNAGDSLGQEDGEDEELHSGELQVEVLGPQEVFWEPGVRFDSAQWHVVEKARTLEQARQIPKYNGTDLKPDARGHGSFLQGQLQKSQAKADMVIVSEYMELPSKAHPKGRRFYVANNQQITETEEYPCLVKGPGGFEPCLHKLPFIPTPHRDRDMGVVEHAIDAQRTVNDCVAGETLVVTKKGLRRADDIWGTVDVLTAEGKFRPAKWGHYGVKPLWRVEFSDGSTVYATENHKWHVLANGDSPQVVHTPDLLNRKVPISSLAPHTPIEDRDGWEEGVRNGMVFGDGTICRYGHSPWRAQFAAYGAEKVDLLERFFDHNDRRESERGGVVVQAKPLDTSLKMLPPFDAGFDYLRGFLAGLIATDGCVNAKGGVIITNAIRSNLEVIATIAKSVGIHANPIREARHGKGGYNDGIYYKLTLYKGSFVDPDGVDEDLLLRPLHRKRMAGSFRGKVRVTARKVVKVALSNRVEQTYCCEEPVTHTWTMGNGLVTSNSVNKSIGWKNLCLVPQILAPVGSLRDRSSDEPGKHISYIPVAGLKPEFREVPPIPSSLFEMSSQALEHMEEIFSNRSVPSQIESGKAIAAYTERDQSVRGFIVQGLADFHSKLGRHLLHHVQRWYTEPRLLMINGKHGAAYIPNFKGAALRDQVNVTIRPGSIEPRTRAGVEARVMMLVDRQLITREKALAALDGGFAEGLLDDIADDQAKQQREIQQMVALGTEALPGGQAPDADDFDSHQVHLDELHRFMKQHEWDLLPEVTRETIRLHEQQHKIFVQQEQAQAQAAQVQQAQQLGMSNATRPASKPMPSAPSPNGQGRPGQSQQPMPQGM